VVPSASTVPVGRHVPPIGTPLTVTEDNPLKPFVFSLPFSPRRSVCPGLTEVRGSVFGLHADVHTKDKFVVATCGGNATAGEDVTIPWSSTHSKATRTGSVVEVS
jgi:hypothetical protein